MVEEKYGTKWSEEETILAFYYYCQIPFGRIHKTNPDIIRLANILGRTPSSVSRKMGNLAHFDPVLKERNVNGLKNASKTDEDVFERFHENWEELSFLAAKIEASFTPGVQTVEQLFPAGMEKERTVKERVNQNFFRSAVLSSYRQSCCITGIRIPELLIASHIKPWAESDPELERTNPSNGLCLNALHDKAFDRGLITVFPDFTVGVSSVLKKERDKEFNSWLIKCDGERIQLPERFVPDREFLEYHNDVIFVP